LGVLAAARHGRKPFIVSGRTALITGGSGGLGFELARAAAADGYTPVLVSSNKERLDVAAERIAGEFPALHGSVPVFAQDLSEPDAADKVLDFLISEQLHVHLLVNDAGFGLRGEFAESDLAAELAMMQVNMTALTALTKRCLPQLVGSGGQVLNVASTAGFFPGPQMAVYYATKAYVVSLSLALREELRGKVSVTVLCPGPINTDFAARADMGRSRLFSHGAMDAAAVAERGWRGAKRGRALVVPGATNKLMVFSTRLAPRTWLARSAGLANSVVARNGAA
jgi:short-subunit dehydrogenase